MRELWKWRGFGKVRVAFVVGIAALAVVGALTYANWEPARAEVADVTATAEPMNKPEPTDQKLDIGEWGVRVSLPGNLSGAYYAASMSSHDPATGEPNTMWLGVASLDANGCDAKQFKTEGAGKPLGALIRVAQNEVDPVYGIPYAERYPGGVMIEGYYYAYIPWKNKTCASKAILDDVDTAFSNAVKGMAKTTPSRTN